MDEAEITTSNFMPRDLTEIICILEIGEKCHSYKIIQKRNYFTLVTKGFPAKNGHLQILGHIPKLLNFYLLN